MNFSKENFSLNDMKVARGAVTVGEIKAFSNMVGSINNLFVETGFGEFTEATKMLMMFNLGKMAALRELENEEKELPHEMTDTERALINKYDEIKKKLEEDSLQEKISYTQKKLIETRDEILERIENLVDERIGNK